MIIDAVHTRRGIGRPGKGVLESVHPHHLSAIVLKALVDRNRIDAADVEDVIWSTAASVGARGSYLGRFAALDAGYDVKASGTTLTRYCDGGITAVGMTAGQIMAGMEDLGVAGGAEVMALIAKVGMEDGALGRKPAMATWATPA